MRTLVWRDVFKTGSRRDRKGDRIGGRFVTLAARIGMYEGMLLRSYLAISAPSPEKGEPHS